MIQQLSKNLWLKLIITDLLVWLMVALIPAFSHLLPVPIYLLEPMRVFLFIGYLISREKGNGYILAVTIPFVSFFISGHPIFLKAGLISVELGVNIFLFERFLTIFPRWSSIALLSSILLSKFFYYFLKFILLNVSLLEGNLMSTPIGYQLLASFFVVIIYYLANRTYNRKS